ncbi:MAG TPA: amino acid ABC transporter ATP-binding protein [Solirubrobacterales bacterium]|nr:amino acid ABC transporter ATP-binding protein [Solirubrobacterales bacterium]
MTTVPVLEAAGVSKIYEGQAVVKEVDLTVGRGEVKAIIGPSGSGKSTFLRCLALLEASDEGQIRLEGEPIGEIRGRIAFTRERQLARERANIGMVFQRFNLFPHLTAEGNVQTALVTVRGLSRHEARERADEMLARVGLAERAHAYPSELSGGQQQRVAIARALVMEPKVMLFDEPTSALDPELVREVLDVIEELAKAGMTMIVVTHELDFARGIASEMVMMDQGLVIERATPDRFFGSPKHSRTRQFLDHME